MTQYKVVARVYQNNRVCGFTLLDRSTNQEIKLTDSDVLEYLLRNNKIDGLTLTGGAIRGADGVKLSELRRDTLTSSAVAGVSSPSIATAPDTAQIRREAQKKRRFSPSVPLPPKKRIMFYSLKAFIDSDKNYNAAILVGIRKIGKTTILKQLNRSYPGSVYLDGDSKAYEDAFTKCLRNPPDLLMIDELTRIPDYEHLIELYNDRISNTHKKLIVSGSATPHLIALSGSKLGSRSRLFRLSFLSYLEYLFFTDKITGYTEIEFTSSPNVSADTFKDYLMLREIPDGFSLTLDDTYLGAVYNDLAVSNEAAYLSSSVLNLSLDSILATSHVLAYTLSENVRHATVLGAPVGKREAVAAGASYDSRKAELSQMAQARALFGGVLSVKTRVQATRYLIMSNLCFFALSEGQTVGRALGELARVQDETGFAQFFSEYNLCLMNPAMYSMLGKDILSRYGIEHEKLFAGSILGLMVEQYIKGSLAQTTTASTLSGYKLSGDDGEVDIIDRSLGLLCEVSIRDKQPDKVNLYRHFSDQKLLRILTTATAEGFIRGRDGRSLYYQLPYPRFCCYIDAGLVPELYRYAV